MNTDTCARRVNTRLTRSLLLLLLVLGLAATAGTARASMIVSHSGSTVTLQVTPASGDGHHFVQIEARRETGAARQETIIFSSVLQAVLTGNVVGPGGIQCNQGLLLNSVECPHVVGLPIVVNVNMGDEGDNVILKPNNFPIEGQCDFAGTDSIELNVNFGGGADGFHFPNVWPQIEPSCPAPIHRFARVTVNSGAGNDNISAEAVSFAEATAPKVGPATIDAGAGNDTVIGTLLADSLLGGSGNDSIAGSDGNDVIFGGVGDDTISGGGGNDTFLPDDTIGIDGADSFSGGPGFDIASYGARTVALDITVGNDQADDGAVGEHDNIVDANEVVGGSAGDRLVGSTRSDKLLGGAGNDTIDGGDGSDTIDGGTGVDNLQGGFGDDTIMTVDGEADVVSCGPSLLGDHAFVDLKDTVLRSSSCEFVTRQAVDDSPPGRPVAGAVRLGSAGAVVGFVCPAAARPACHGQLTVRDPAGSHRVLGRASYAFGLGKKGTVEVALDQSELTLLRRRGHVVVETVEQGHSDVGPRGVSFVLAIAG